LICVTVMQVINFEPLAKTIVINSINIYQKRISPHKGFSCSHRIVNGGESCSDYIKRTFSQQNLTQSVKFSLQRFKDCSNVSKTLSTKNGFRCIVIPCCLPL
jgi:putative component of membrane protein insertase Oxa1/YidC/SpoIIIJ protein YidD